MALTGMNLENIILNERSQMQKETVSFHSIEAPGMNKEKGPHKEASMVAPCSWNSKTVRKDISTV